MIPALEELALNAWPALQTVCYDGWLLRFAGGYTRRANSVSALYSSTLPLHEKIAYCEAAYTRKRLNTAFRLTDAARPYGLDDALNARGYQRQSATSVQLLDDLRAFAPPQGEDFRAEPYMTEAWLDAHIRLNHVAERHGPALRRMLASVTAETCYSSLRRDGEIAALAYAALDRGCLTLYSVVTAGRFRRRGLGRALMHHLLGWGHERGAERALLHVKMDNAPALALYGGLGFREVYQYWYRVKPLPEE